MKPAPGVLWLLLLKPSDELCEVDLYYIDQSNFRTSSLTYTHVGFCMNLFNFSAWSNLGFYLNLGLKQRLGCRILKEFYGWPSDDTKL